MHHPRHHHRLYYELLNFPFWFILIILIQLLLKIVVSLLSWWIIILENHFNTLSLKRLAVPRVKNHTVYFYNRIPFGFFFVLFWLLGLHYYTMFWYQVSTLFRRHVTLSGPMLSNNDTYFTPFSRNQNF